MYEFFDHQIGISKIKLKYNQPRHTYTINIQMSPIELSRLPVLMNQFNSTGEGEPQCTQVSDSSDISLPQSS